MRISSKGRYGLASIICVAQMGQSGEPVTIISIADRLGISKIYLEQVFSLLKRSGLVTSTKGAQGGYRLTKALDEISAFDILEATEGSIFEKTEASVEEKAQGIEKAMNNLVWDSIDEQLAKHLKAVSLKELAEEATKNQSKNQYMFYI